MRDEREIPMTRAEKLILERLEKIEKEIARMREEREDESVREISLHRAARLLGIGDETLKAMAKRGAIRAVVYRDRTRKKRYRFRLADIREFQKGRETKTEEDFEGIETAEEIAKRIFINGKTEY